MPYAAKQRREAFQRQNQPDGGFLRFVHYTSAEAALEIIKTKRIWMRNATCMADFKEVQHGFEMLNSFLSDRSREQFDKAFDLVFPGVAEQAIEKFNKNWLNTQLDTYITSISEHLEEEDSNGRLSMWRAYGSGTARVAIVFKVPMTTLATVDLRMIFSPVAYLKEKEAHAVVSHLFAQLPGIISRGIIN